jgi:hypothetical protein
MAAASAGKNGAPIVAAALIISDIFIPLPLLDVVEVIPDTL